MKVTIDRVQVTGNPLYKVTVEYKPGRWFSVEVDVTEEETAQGPGLIQESVLTAALLVLGKALKAVEKKREASV